MALPYHVLKVCGGVVFAARAGSIYSFNSDFQYVSAWEYPVKQQQQTKAQEAPAGEQKDSPAPEGPPTKRRKVESSKEQPASNGNGHVEGTATQENKPKKKGKEYTSPADRPFVQGLYSTSDGRHLVAITGSDKTIWVFEHDGAGNLKLLSQRMMPKRPCDIAITPDNRTILSADKFGDVYALPLLAAEEAQWAQEMASAVRQLKSRSATPSSTSQPYKPQANEFTVHTLRNRKALENQKLILEQRAKEEEEKRKSEGPQFEHTLLLGHVSMLTAITVGVSPVNNKQYIITADRDEHIRISRSMPQAHIIEGFCLGHDEFISIVTIPPTRPELLISGGGDDELYVWNWPSNQLLSKTNLLKEAQKLFPETSKLAVTRIFTTHVKAKSYSLVFIICERLPAVFCFQLKDEETNLIHKQTIPLQDNTNPLDVEYLPTTSPRLLVAVDPNSGTSPTNSSSARSISVFSQEAEQEDEWQLTDKFPVNINTNGLEPASTIGDGDQEEKEQEKPITVQELQKILYTTESLRKTAMDFD